ncbi:hypothetical protein Ocin01_16548 [Orchesella cincta]|uniref:Uncharacterized protein n=1 Tax=Orchesella cincta TaxID=48709 RepID=A0A1D2MAY2_ORCCI|nr:hypothetical protein Ocin01_16548 [Orchesella cincta]
MNRELNRHLNSNCWRTRLEFNDVNFSRGSGHTSSLVFDSSFMGSALIHGIKRQRPSFLKVWMIYEGCEIVAVTLLYIFLMSTNSFADLFTNSKSR